MKPSRALAVLSFLLLLLQTSCGGSVSVNTNPPPSAQTAPVSLTITDTPPAGITILAFEVTITRATLQPGNVQLIASPLTIEVKRLETEAALLNTINVPAGTYTSIEITFTNPELSFKNDTAAPIFLPGLTCSVGAVCEFKPAITATVSYSGPPFPLTVASGTPLGLLLDVNLSNIIDNALGLNFNAANAIMMTSIPAAGGQFRELEDVVGRVTAKDTANNQFTLQTSLAGQSFIVRVDNNTVFDDFNDIGLANNFASLAVGQIVEVDLTLMSGGTLVAKKVELEDDANREEAEGVVISVAPAGFFMVLMDETPDIVGIEVGNLLDVLLASSTSFGIDDDGLNIPSSFLFQGTQDMMPGQVVQVRRTAASIGTFIVPDRVRLSHSRFTARVKSVSIPGATGFSVDSFPALFASASSEIEVFTSSQTGFEGVSGVSGLAVGNIVSLRGLLFKTTGRPSPALVASKVRKR